VAVGAMWKEWMTEGSWFVYRSPYEGPSGRRVRRLPDATPLAWFQRLWQTTADEERFDRDADAHDWVEANLEADLGGHVYGLSSVFSTSDNGASASLRADRRGPLPASTWQELEELLRRHLHVEGGPHDQIHVDEHSVRVGTDDDEVDLAYYFFDDTLAAASDQTAYLLLEDWRLPVALGEGGRFDEPAGVRRLTARRGGTGASYVVALKPEDHFAHSCDLVPPTVLVGVRLPELASHLRSVRPSPADPGWPATLLILRSLVAPMDQRVGPTLRRYTHSVGRMQERDAAEQVRRSATQGHATAHGALEELLQRPPPGQGTSWSEPDAARSCVSDTEHLVQALVHVHELFGYERWYLFDDVWADSHPELAASLLRYASSWDPFDAADAPGQGCSTWVPGSQKGHVEWSTGHITFH
jgi:hypothetical protein